MSFCPNCGKEIKETGRFCGECGYSLATKNPSQEVAGQNAPVQEIPVDGNEKKLAVVAHLGVIIVILVMAIFKIKSTVFTIFLILSLLIAPYIYWRGRQHESFSSKHALQAVLLNTFLATVIVGFSWYMALAIDKYGTFFASLDNGFLSAIIVLILPFIAILFPLYASYKAIKGKELSYPFMPKVMTKNKWIVVGLCIAFCVVGSIAIYSIENNMENKSASKNEIINTLADEPNYTCNMGGKEYLGYRNNIVGVAIYDIEEMSEMVTSYKGTVRAQGMFRVVHILATSYANKQVQFGRIMIVTTDGDTYSEDINAFSTYKVMNLRKNRNESTLNQEFINPNQTIKNVYVFDIPKDSVIKYVLYKPGEYGEQQVILPYFVNSK